MAEPTLDRLLEELGTLDVEGQGERFDEIIAELINHADELGPKLPELAASLRFQHRCGAAMVYARRSAPPDAAAVRRLLGDANPRVRSRAAAAAVACAEVREKLRELVEDTDEDVRISALRSLGRAGGEAKAIAPALRGEAWRVREAAAKALAGTRELAAFGPLCAALDDGDADVRRATEDALGPWLGELGDGVDAALAALPEDVPPKLTSYFSTEDRPAAMAPLRHAMARRAEATQIPTELAAFGKVVGGAGDPPPIGGTFERDDLVEKLLEQLARPGNRSTVLVGESGVGKTHLIYELARRAAPSWTLLETSTSEVMVGTKWMGEWETKLRDLIGKAKHPRRVILYLTNINNLGNAGRSSTNEGNFAAMMGSYMRRGELTVFGESTPKALHAGLDKDGALKRLFHYINVPELDAAGAMRILRRHAEELSTKLRTELVVPQESLDQCTDLAAAYFSGMVEPGRSITLLDQVVAKRLTDGPAPPPGGVVEIGSHDVVTGLAHSTGLPERLLNDHQPLDPGEVRAFFHERVLGQAEAVAAMTDLITLIKSGLTEPGKPLGVLFFVGPTGVGKTEIAKALAEYIFGSPDRMVRVDMSEYKDYESFEKLIGGTWRREEGGYLTSKIREQPFSVVLLDEFEKAHPNIFDLMLQCFDDGRLTDGRGITTDFRQTIIIMTSNLASQVGDGFGFGAETDVVPSADKVLREMRRFFRPEFLNRLGKVVVFKPLAPDVMRKIVQRELGKVVLRSGILRRKLLVDIDPAVVDHLMASGFSIAFGARPLKRRVTELVLQPLAREIVTLGAADRGSLLRVFVEDPHKDGGRIEVRRRRQRRDTPRPERRRAPAPAAAAPAEAIAALRTRVGALGQRVESLRLAERRGAIVAETSTPSFWDDAPRARHRLAELVQLEEVIEAEARLRGKLDDLESLARGTRQAAGVVARFHEGCQALADDLAEVEHLFFAADAIDRRDVFLWVRRIGTDRDGGDAAVEIERMYAGWAARRGVTVTAVHAVRDAAGPVESIWLLEGAGLFALLKREDGLHLFEQGGKGADRRQVYVRVQILAHAGDERLPRKDVRLERRTRAGRVELTAEHGPSGVVADASGPAPGESLEELALDLLAARVANRTGGGDADRVVRRYGVEGRFAHDQDTGLRSPQREVFAGGLDEMLRARLLG